MIKFREDYTAEQAFIQSQPRSAAYLVFGGIASIGVTILVGDQLSVRMGKSPTHDPSAIMVGSVISGVGVVGLIAVKAYGIFFRKSKEAVPYFKA